MLWAEKNSYKEFDKENHFLRLKKFPSPPITFLMVHPLFNNLYLTYNPLEYSTNWKSGEGLITSVFPLSIYIV